MSENAVICPKCQSTNILFLKSWQIKPSDKYSKERNQTHTCEVSLYRCKDCGKKFRKGKKV